MRLNDMKTIWFAILQTIIKSLIGSLDYEQVKLLVMDIEIAVNSLKVK